MCIRDSTLTTDQNCQFIQDVISKLTTIMPSYGFRIYSDAKLWTKAFGGITGCSVLNKYQVGYEDFNDVANMDDWQSQEFGGWQTPSLKTYTKKAVCGQYVELYIQ
eukprot:TRINITY_DN2079_c0_g1_i2.p3 TRINITY_DN2079_c0_g1~~TRINITY_DN2079_c0_g1_i2.p3  ORF type:complete len:106 (+),score=15.14 TRINITY_DN2079_c0_g1_i2:176-493(+)